MKSLLLAASAVLALSVVGSSEVSAQHRCRSGSVYRGAAVYSSPRLSVSVGYGNVGFGNIGYGNVGYGNVGYSGFHPGYSGYQQYQAFPVYGSRVHRTWHDTTHLDYHGPSLVPHRGHLDYVPGHYDVHRTGHWDIHHH